LSGKDVNGSRGCSSSSVSGFILSDERTSHIEPGYRLFHSLEFVTVLSVINQSATESGLPQKARPQMGLALLLPSVVEGWKVEGGEGLKSI
jgi:hypothetical protein